MLVVEYLMLIGFTWIVLMLWIITFLPCALWFVFFQVQFINYVELVLVPIGLGVCRYDIQTTNK